MMVQYSISDWPLFSLLQALCAMKTLFRTFVIMWICEYVALFTPWFELGTLKRICCLQLATGSSHVVAIVQVCSGVYY